MEIIVLTRGRYNDNFILNFLPDSFLKNITICCHKGEAKYYENYNGKVKHIKEYIGNNVAEARHWCIEDTKEKKLLFIEDNVSLFVRGADPDFGEKNNSMLYKLDKSRFKEERVVGYLNKLINKIEVKLSSPEFAIIGISSRGGNNNIKEEFTENCRLYGFWAIDVEKYNAIEENINDVIYREDFYIMLSFIKNTYKIGVYYDYCFDKIKGVNSPGGCSEYRKQSGTNENAKQLAKKFYPFVNVSKNEKKNWAGYVGEILDIKVQWKKMYNYYKQQKESITLF